MSIKMFQLKEKKKEISLGVKKRMGHIYKKPENPKS
jgi:hypothetical protein